MGNCQCLGGDAKPVSNDVHSVSRGVDPALELKVWENGRASLILPKLANGANASKKGTGGLRPLTTPGYLTVKVDKANLTTPPVDASGLFAVIEFGKQRYRSEVSSKLKTPEFDSTAEFTLDGIDVDVVTIVLWDASGSKCLGAVNLDVTRLVTNERPAFVGAVGIYSESDIKQQIGILYVYMSFEPATA